MNDKDVSLSIYIKVDPHDDPSTEDWFITASLDRSFDSCQPVVVSKSAALKGETINLTGKYVGFMPSISQFTHDSAIPASSYLILRYYEKDNNGYFVKKLQARRSFKQLSVGKGRESLEFTARSDQKVDHFMITFAATFDSKIVFKPDLTKESAALNIMTKFNASVRDTLEKWFDLSELRQFMWLYNMNGFEFMENISFILTDKVKSTPEFWNKIYDECMSVKTQLGLPVTKESIWMDMICVIPARIFDYAIDLFGDDFESPFLHRNGDCEDFAYCILVLFDALLQANFDGHEHLKNIQACAAKYFGFFTICSTFAKKLNIKNGGGKSVAGHVCTIFIPKSQFAKMIPRDDYRTEHTEALIKYLESKETDEVLPIFIGEGTNYLEPACTVYDVSQRAYGALYKEFQETVKVLNTARLEDNGSGFYDRFIQIHTQQILTETRGMIPYTGFVLTLKFESSQYGLEFNQLLNPDQLDEICAIPLPPLTHAIIDIAINQSKNLARLPNFGEKTFVYSKSSQRINDHANIDALKHDLDALIKELKLKNGHRQNPSTQMFFFNPLRMHEVMDNFKIFVRNQCISLTYELFNPSPDYFDFRLTVAL